MFTCWDGKGGELSGRASKYKLPGAVYIASYKAWLDQSDCWGLFVQLWNYTKFIYWLQMLLYCYRTESHSISPFHVSGWGWKGWHARIPRFGWCTGEQGDIMGSILHVAVFLNRKQLNWFNVGCTWFLRTLAVLFISYLPISVVTCFISWNKWQNKLSCVHTVYYFFL